MFSKPALSPLLPLFLTLLACNGDGTPAGPGTTVEMKTDFGVTAEPCPGGNPNRGCIYLGTILDHSGPFAITGPIYMKGIRAFWQRANAGDGVGGHYDVTLPDHLSKDNGYNPATHTAAYTRIADDILALAASLGTPTTIDSLPRLIEDQTMAVPITFWSGWSFARVDHGLTLEYLPSYCFEGMNSMDWAVQEAEAAAAPKPAVGIVYFPSDYGRDYGNGIKTAAAAHGVTVAWEQTVVPIAAGGDPAQVEAVNRIAGEPVDVVFMATGPSELASIVGGAVQRGFEGRFVTGSPGWDAGLMRTAAAPAFSSGQVFGSGSVGPWGADSPGHREARERLSAAGLEPHDYAISAWVSQYRLRAVLAAAAANGDLTRAGLVRASSELAPVALDGMRPPGDWSDPDTAPRSTLIGRFDPSAPTGVVVARDFFVGSTAAGYAFERPCTETN